MELPTTCGDRVCGTPSAVAPTVTTTSHFSLRAHSTMQSANVVHCRCGSTPDISTKSREPSGKRATTKSFSGQRMWRSPSSSRYVSGRSWVKSKNGSGSMLPTTTTSRSCTDHSSAPVATPATSNQPRSATTKTGSRNGPTASQSASSTSLMFIG